MIRLNVGFIPHVLPLEDAFAIIFTMTVVGRIGVFCVSVLRMWFPFSWDHMPLFDSLGTDIAIGFYYGIFILLGSIIRFLNGFAKTKDQYGKCTPM
ncbi:hypothetical protein [Leptospira yanagawae]|nr:hypothetical protein [Leptospira yanagawae]